MYPRRILTIITFSVIMLAIIPLTLSAVDFASFKTHHIGIKLDVPAHAATIYDSGELELAAGVNLIKIPETAKLTTFLLNDKAADHAVFSISDTLGLKAAAGGVFPELEDDGPYQLLLVTVTEAQTAVFQIEYSAVFDQDVSQTHFSRETVGGEIRGAIGEQGAYLSSASYYYPTGKEEAAYFSLTAELPEGWYCVSDGNDVEFDVVGDANMFGFENPYISDGNMFMAAPYVVQSEQVGSIDVYCYFFAEDTALIAGYLEATVGYIKMYTELIGPYPYNRFTVAENFFPTGYGMPAWTLLGQQVIRLPFIKSSSLGHEVLHNWWGNSVYVDYDRGNWCESATVYGADYRYKLMESPEAAKDYRKNILKEYLSYVREGNDFPIRDFKGRSSAETRVIGYNKGMMVWHMIEEEIGSEAFWQAWRIVYERYITQRISWEEWIAVFEETSGKDLAHIIPQWIDRAGAPELDLEINSITDGYNGEREISFTIKQNANAVYDLKVPVVVAGVADTKDTVVSLTTATATYSIVISANASVIQIDPDYHLFRKLYPEEVEPIVSAVTGAPAQYLICDVADSTLSWAFNDFGDNIAGDPMELHPSSETESFPEGAAPILINPENIPAYYGDMIQLEADSIRILDSWYPRAGHTFVLSGNNYKDAEKFMLLLTTDPESLSRLGQLVPHYGKYSWLVFEGAKNVGKGQWPVTSSPLKKKF